MTTLIANIKQSIIDDNFEMFKLLCPVKSENFSGMYNIFDLFKQHINKKNEHYIKWIIDNINFGPQYDMYAIIIITLCSLDLLKYYCEKQEFKINQGMFWMIEMNTKKIKNDYCENLRYLCQINKDEMNQYKFGFLYVGCYYDNLEFCKYLYNEYDLHNYFIRDPPVVAKLSSMIKFRNNNRIIEWFQLLNPKWSIDNYKWDYVYEHVLNGRFDDNIKEVIDNLHLNNLTIQLFFKMSFEKNIKMADYLYSKYPDIIDDIVYDRHELNHIIRDKYKFKWFLLLNIINIDKFTIHDLCDAFSFNSKIVYQMLLSTKKFELQDIIDNLKNYKLSVNLGMNEETMRFFSNKFGKDKLIELIEPFSNWYFNAFFTISCFTDYNENVDMQTINYLYNEGLLDINKIYELIGINSLFPQNNIDRKLWLFKKLKEKHMDINISKFNDIIGLVNLGDIIIETLLLCVSKENVLYDQNVYKVIVRSYLFY